MKAESWRKLSVWPRYVPEVLPLNASEQGSPNVLMVLQLIEEKPNISLHYPFHSNVPCARSGPGKHGLTFLGDGRLTHEFGARSNCPSPNFPEK